MPTAFVKDNFTLFMFVGAVKLNNFIPWDIDMDLYIKTEDMHYFHSGGKAR